MKGLTSLFVLTLLACYRRKTRKTGDVKVKKLFQFSNDVIKGGPGSESLGTRF